MKACAYQYKAMEEFVVAKNTRYEVWTFGGIEERTNGVRDTPSEHKIENRSASMLVELWEHQSDGPSDRF